LPHLTVLIPTRDRPAQLKLAVASVCEQVDLDLELIVSDNSSNEICRAENRRTISRLRTDVPVRYVSPPRTLAMPDHWDWAIQHATGEYVTILTDRFVLRPSASKLLKTLTSKASIETVVSWNAYSCFLQAGTLSEAPYSNRILQRHARECLEEFSSLRHLCKRVLWHNDLPRTLCACFPRSVAELIRQKHGRLFFPLSPDYTSAFLLLAYCKEYFYVDRPLSLSHGNKSTGQDALVHGFRRYVESVGQPDWVERSPVPIPSTTNAIIVDYLFARELAPSRFPKDDVPLGRLLLANLYEFQKAVELGTKRDIAAEFGVWRTVVNTLPEPTRSDLLDRSQKARLSKRKSMIYGRVKRCLREQRLIYLAYSIGMRLRARLKGEMTYVDALHAARATDANVWGAGNCEAIDLPS
jgi:hypothetical protein